MSSIATDAAPSASKPAGFVSNRQAAGWGVGTMATSTMLNGVSVVLLYFLVSYVKMEPVVVGAMLFGAKLLDVFTDPPMGLLSDRTKSKYGRRRPYLLGSAFFCGISFAMLFNVPEMSLAASYLFIGAGLVLYALSYTAFQIPYMAMPAEMTNDSHQRTKIMSWRVVFMTLGNMVGFAGAPALVSALGNDRSAYGEMGLIYAAAIVVLMVLTFFATASVRQTEAVARQEQVPIAQHLVWLRQNKPLMILMGTKISIYIGLSANIAVALFFIQSVLKMTPEMLGLYGVTMAATSIAFLPVCNWLSRRIGKKPAYIFSLLGFSVALLSWLLAVPGEPIAVFIARAFFIGMFAAGAHLYGQSMLIDTFAYDRKYSGIRREGVLSASFSFVEKTCMAFGPLIIGALLSTMGFDKDLAPTEDQSESAVQAMYLGFIWIPLGCQAVSIVLLKFYRLTDKELAEVDGAV